MATKDPGRKKDSGGDRRDQKNKKPPLREDKRHIKGEVDKDRPDSTRNTGPRLDPNDNSG